MSGFRGVYFEGRWEKNWFLFSNRARSGNELIKSAVAPMRSRWLMQAVQARKWSAHRFFCCIASTNHCNFVVLFLFLLSSISPNTWQSDRYFKVMPPQENEPADTATSSQTQSDTAPPASPNWAALRVSMKYLFYSIVKSNKCVKITKLKLTVYSTELFWYFFLLNFARNFDRCEEAALFHLNF